MTHPDTQEAAIADLTERAAIWEASGYPSDRRVAASLRTVLAHITTLQARAEAAEAENLALREVETAARKLPRGTPAPGGAGTEHPFMIAAAHVWDNDRALLALDKHRTAALTTPSSEGA